MQVKFFEDKTTSHYGKVKAGEPVDVSDEDGKAFIDNGLAKKVRVTKSTGDTKDE